jgi:hypothetical protein
LQNQLISVGWLGTGFTSGAELVKEVFQSGVLELRMSRAQPVRLPSLPFHKSFDLRAVRPSNCLKRQLKILSAIKLLQFTAHCDQDHTVFG